MASFDHWYDSRNNPRLVVTPSYAQSRIDGKCVDPVAVLSITIFRVSSRVLVGRDLLLVSRARAQ
jgi:hypothetical protein